MAYTAIPGRRVPYDVFGIGWDRSSDVGGTVQLTPAEIAGLNDETQSTNIGAGAPYGYFNVQIGFQIPVNITGYWVGGTYNSSEAPLIYRSIDTDDGLNGTWTSAPLTVEATPTWRGNITSVVWNGVRGIRVYSGSSGTGGTGILQGLHIYGTYDYPGLNVYDSAGTAVTTGAFWDFGDRVRGFSTTKQFTVKNTSSLRANGVTVGLSFPTEASPTLASQFSLSAGGAYAPTQSIGDLAAGAVSGPLTLKYDTLANAQIGPWSGRITLTAASWTV